MDMNIRITGYSDSTDSLIIAKEDMQTKHILNTLFENFASGVLTCTTKRGTLVGTLSVAK